MKKHDLEKVLGTPKSKKLPSQQFSAEQVKQLRTEADDKPMCSIPYAKATDKCMSYVR